MSDTMIPGNIMDDPLAPIILVFLHFLLAHYPSAFTHVENKP